jgi:hypothetical protein
MNNKKIILIIGWIGTAVLCIAYGLNALGYISSTGLAYSISNLVAAILLGLRVGYDKNWSNVLLEIFFGGVAVIALIKYFLY